MGDAKRTVFPAQGAVRGALLSFQSPQLGTLATKAPADEGWVSEVKFDGYRLLVAIDNGVARLLTRSGLDWTKRMPALATSLAKLGPSAAMLDGELVALAPDGVSSFQMLQAALKAGQDASLVFYAFDLLHLDGWDLRPCPLLERKRVLAAASSWTGQARYSDHHEGQAADLHKKACAIGLEGIICKRADRPYRAGRGGDWIKLKCLHREELIVLGYSPPGSSRVGIAGLQLGYYDHDGRLHYAGGVGTGFNEVELKRLRSRLDEMRVAEPDVCDDGEQVAFKLTRQEQNARHLIATKLSQSAEAVSIVLADYISVLGSARDFRDSVAARLRAEFDGKSEKFRDSRQGDAVAGFCDLWENLDLDDPHLDVDHTQKLEDAPTELE